MNWSRSLRVAIIAGTVGIGTAALAAGPDFDDDRAYAQLSAYMHLSPIQPGTSASATFAQYVKSQLEPLGFKVETDEWTSSDAPVSMRNLVATKGTGQRIHLIGAHYDTRIFADKDPDASKRRDPVPGANDGGSGVAVLLELARAVQVPADSTLRLAFFDAEDQGEIEGYSGWILGSTRMAARLTEEERSRISEVIVVDIVGDPQLRLVAEGNSDPGVAARVWELAKSLGYGDTFVAGKGSAILDDHIPFHQLGLPVLDLIQLEGRDGSSFFPWHHTTLDTIDHVGRSSLGRVGRTLEKFIETAPSERSESGLFLRQGTVWPVLGLAGGLLGVVFMFGPRKRRPARRSTARHAPGNRRNRRR